MSRFYGEIQGSRGKASRQGTPASGIWAHVRGWDVGILVECSAGVDDLDLIWVSLTRGSNGGVGSNKTFALARNADDGPELWIQVTPMERVKLSDLIDAWANK